MRKNLSRLFLLALATSAPVLTGCGKVKGVVGKLNQLKAEVAGSSSAATLPSTYSSDQITEVNQGNYEAFIARKDALVVVDFHAEWCGPCKMLGPVLAKAAEAHPGVVYLGKVDVDQSPELAGEQKVSSIPDVRIFKNGVEVDRFVGYPGEAEVMAKIATLSTGIQPTPAATAAAAPDAKQEPKIKPFKKDWLPPGVTRQGELSSDESGVGKR